MYQAYLIKKSQHKEKVKSEDSYKKSVGTRWESMRFVRSAYKLSV